MLKRLRTVWSKQISIGSVLGIAAIVALVAFVGGTRVELAAPGSQNAKLGKLDFTNVENTYQVLRDKFDGKLDSAKLIEGAKKGLVEAAGDPYTVYFSESEAKEFLNELDGKFTGIGAELDIRDKKLIVVSTLDDSPARKAGLLPNDVIAKVNDQDTSTWTIDKAVSQIRGEKGTTVKLLIVRDNSEVKEFPIVRDQIINPSVKTEITADNIGIIRISRFAQTDTVELTRKAALDFKAKGVKGIVIDVRGNGGGYLNAAQDIASLWLDNKVVVEERRDGKVVETLKSGNSPIIAGIPTVVLIDGGSASASEILAGALHDNNAAKLVGVKSFGKGSVQKIEDIPGGGQLKVTIAKWYTPNGKNISKEGIQPDTKVELSPEDVKNGRDLQKDKAIELLKNR